MMHTVLIADEEPSQRNIIEHVICDKLHYRTIGAKHAQEMLEWVAQKKKPQPDLILVDLSIPSRGLKLLEEFSAKAPDVPIVALTLYGDIETAAIAMKKGAVDFLSKPISLERLEISLHNALHISVLRKEVMRLARKQSGAVSFSDLLSVNTVFVTLKSQCERLARGKALLLLSGETGTGKEMMARAIHSASARANAPFVTVNCASLPAGREEAALFGCLNVGETDRGKLAEAEGGTLYLANIEKLKLELQVKVLRLLQENNVIPLGSREPRSVDVRVIASTTASLLHRVELGQFRSDLYHVLSGATIHLPALRDRKEDIEMLARHFIARHATHEQRYVTEISHNALELLMGQPWFGNVRQLEDAICRAVMLAQGTQLEATDFAQLVAGNRTREGRPHEFAAHVHAPGEGPPDKHAILPLIDTHGHIKRMDQLEAEAIRYALQYYGGHMSEVARRLGIGRSTLYRKIHDLNITIEQAA